MLEEKLFGLMDEYFWALDMMDEISPEEIKKEYAVKMFDAIKAEYLYQEEMKLKEKQFYDHLEKIAVRHNMDEWFRKFRKEVGK